MKKALLIGGTGVISLSVTRRLLQSSEWDVTVLNRGTHPELLPKGAKLLCCDIADEAAAVQALSGQYYDCVAQFINFTPEQAQRDVRLFSGKTAQYIFISSASAYRKPMPSPWITESTALCNPYWQYSRDKIACERILFDAFVQSGFPVTVVRPSHTYDCRKIPVQLHGKIGSWQVAERIRQGKPVVVAGDGTSLWTLTHSRDFAKGFVGLMANPAAIGEAVHITSDESIPWNEIYRSLGRALGREPIFCHVASDAIIRRDPAQEGPLLGDKSNSVLFDNHKLKRLVPGFCAETRIESGLRESVEYALAHAELMQPDPAFDAWCDQVIREEMSD